MWLMMIMMMSVIMMTVTMTISGPHLIVCHHFVSPSSALSVVGHPVNGISGISLPEASCPLRRLCFLLLLLLLLRSSG